MLFFTFFDTTDDISDYKAMNGETFSPEKNLTDYWNTLVKRWKVIVLVIALTFFGGTYYLKTRSPLPFPYKAVIEIGGVDGALIESSSKSIWRLNDFYIPLALAEHAKERSYEEERYTITVNGEGEGNIVLFGTFGGRDAEKDIVPLLQRIANELFADHARKIEAIRRGIAKERFAKEQEFQKVIEEIAFLPTRMRRINEKVTLVKQELAETKSAIQTIEKNRSIVVLSESRRSAPEESLATTLLILDNDLQKNREKLHALEEQLQIGLQTERDELEKIKKDLSRQKEGIERMIDDIQYRLEHTRETNFLIPPSRFLRKTPTASRTIFQFTFLIGIFLGVFAAFFVEFIAQARRVARQGSS